MLIRNLEKQDRDINQFPIILVQLWDSCSIGIKCAYFKRQANNETGEIRMKLHPERPYIYMLEANLRVPTVAWLQGQAAKEFLLKQGYKIIQKTKTIQKI